eukprot:COSAG01_NODE_20438_length_953_cov_1.142857_1_plen_76_part_10
MGRWVKGRWVKRRWVKKRSLGEKALGEKALGEKASEQKASARAHPELQRRAPLLRHPRAVLALQAGLAREWDAIGG